MSDNLQVAQGWGTYIYDCGLAEICPWVAVDGVREFIAVAGPVGTQHQFQTPFSNRVTAKMLKGRHIVVECNVESLI